MKESFFSQEPGAGLPNSEIYTKRVGFSHQNWKSCMPDNSTASPSTVFDSFQDFNFNCLSLNSLTDTEFLNIELF
jgi:hypothetical protein